jgi:geranylgeranyl reductase family protein
VVGAGPAGCSAARAAAENGARTLLVERAELPRYKTCGGGLIGASLASLPVGMRIPVRDQITEATFSYQGKHVRTKRSSSPFITMINRDEFDSALTKAAQEAGVVVEDRTLVRKIENNDDGTVSLTTDQQVLKAKAVIGADGSASRIARFVGVKCTQIDLGLEVELDASAVVDSWRGRIHLDWGPIRGSYAWVFPKGETLTVGVIAAKGNSDAAHAYLDQFIRATNLTGLPVVRSSGHLTRCRSADSPMARGRVLVAGDAAGLLEPWTREGISFALRSGTLAGLSAARIAKLDDNAVERAGVSYVHDISRKLGSEIAAGNMLYAIYRRFPVLFHLAVVDTVPGWRAFVRVSSGDTNFGRALRRKPVAALARILRLVMSE